jgi:uncharacterized protein
MRLLRVHNVTRDITLADRAGAADNFWLRLRGLLGRPPLRAGDGLLLTPCSAVHMMGMKYPIDVAFVDREGLVVGLKSDLPPGGKSGWHRGARHALELPAGTLAATGTAPGDRLSIESIQDAPR